MHFAANAENYLFHCFSTFPHVSFFGDPLGSYSWSDNREGFFLRTRQELWPGILIHLSRWHYETLDMPLLYGRKGHGKFCYGVSSCFKLEVTWRKHNCTEYCDTFWLQLKYYFFLKIILVLILYIWIVCHFSVMSSCGEKQCPAWCVNGMQSASDICSRRELLF